MPLKQVLVEVLLLKLCLICRKRSHDASDEIELCRFFLCFVPSSTIARVSKLLAINYQVNVSEKDLWRIRMDMPTCLHNGQHPISHLDVYRKSFFHHVCQEFDGGKICQL